MVIFGTICFTVFIVILGDSIYKPEYFIIKCVMFGALGLSTALPAPHIWYLEFEFN